MPESMSMATRSFVIRSPLFPLLCSALLLAACSEQPAGTTAQPAAQPQVAASSALATCQQLAGMTFAADSIGLPTTGADVISAELIAADASNNTNGEYCKVLGAIHPVDS